MNPGPSLKPHESAPLKRPTLSVVIIARNNELTIDACLASARPWADQIVVVDTGSTDRTAEIAQSFGAEVYLFPWIDDFAAARNASLAYATGDWCFWLDTDDSMDAANGARLRALVDSFHPPDVLAYVIQVKCPGVDRDGQVDVTVVDHVKLFRNRPDLRFEGRIHEQILPAIRRAGGDVVQTDIFVVHSGADHSPAGRQRKLERDLRILAQDLAERPNHAFVLFNLGMTYADAGEHRTAIKFLRRCLRIADRGESQVPKAYALLVSSLTAIKKYVAAKVVVQRACQWFPDDPELRFRQALLAQEMGQFAEAASLYRDLLHLPPTTANVRFKSIVEGIAGYKARHNLALAETATDRLDQAEVQWRTIIAERPDYVPAWRALGHDLLRRGRCATLEVLIERAERLPAVRLDAQILRGRLLAKYGALEDARHLLQRIAQESPHSREAWIALAEFLFEHGPPDAAEPVIRHLTDLDPEDGASWHNLGQIQRRLGRLPAARESFTYSLKYRPDAPHTRQCLAEVEAALGVAQ